MLPLGTIVFWIAYMSQLKFIGPVGFYPPVLWDEASIQPNRLLLLANICLRFLFYPFNYAISTFITLGYIVIATFYNIIWLAGGAFNTLWSEKTKQFNEIAIRRSLWAISDVFFFLWNQAALLIGLFLPENGQRTLTHLKEMTEPLSKESFFHLDWKEPHIKRLKLFIADIKHYFPHSPLRALTSLLLGEPVEALLFGLRMPRGETDTFHEYGLNPTELSESQKEYAPALLIHGNYHNQSAWLPLAKYLHDTSYPGPIFTVNLPSGPITDRDYEIINHKCAEIRRLTEIPIAMIGHSRGGVFIFYTHRP